MKFKQNIENDSYVVLVLFHIAIGILVYLFKPLSTVYFVVALVYFLAKIFYVHNSKKAYQILLACAYFTGAEVLFRMTKGGLSYEASKYLIILFSLIGMFYNGLSGKGYPYFIYLILLVPSIVVAATTLSVDAKFRTNIAFVLSGPVALGIASLFLYNRRVTKNQLFNILKFILLPILSITTYLFLYTPTVKEVLSNTASNSATSGGFGPNQVSTVLGLGIFTVIVRIFMKSPTLGMKFFNILLLGAMTFRAIVTFSRGGVVAAIIVVIAFLFLLYNKSTYRRKTEIVVSTMILIFAIIATWFISSDQTQGLIDKRYTNRDVLNRKKEDISTGRVRLFREELEGFVTNPFLGLGASKVKDIRVEKFDHHLPSHNEIGRILSEHGLLGVIILSILLFKPLGFRSSNKSNLFFYAFLAFWFATINHSGMRIAAPSFLYALSLINVVNEKSPIHRKQLKS